MTNLFLSVFEISVSISLVVVALILSASFLNKRYAAKWKYLIWIFLALRLILPFRVTDVQSVVDMLSQIGAQTASESENIHADTLPNATAPRRIIVEIPAQMTTPITNQSEKSNIGTTRLDIVAFVWMIGGLTFISVHLISYLHYKRQVIKRGTTIRNTSILNQMFELKRELHIKRTIYAVEYPEAASPMIIGFFKPVLVLPKEQYRSEELFFILKHELIHLKRGDVYFKLLFVAANAVHWFNPLIWIMQKEATIDMELSCDERVTQGTSYDVRKAYTETLFSTLHQQCAKRTVLSTQFYGGKQVMKKRFKNILLKTKKKNGLFILISAAVLTVSLGMLIGCSINESDHDKLLEEGRKDSITVPDNMSENAEEPENTEESKNAKTIGVIVPTSSEIAKNADKIVFWVMLEGEMYEMPASLFVGDGYSIYLTDGNWQQYAPDAWFATVDGEPVLNGQVQIWITHFEDKAINQVKEELTDDGYISGNPDMTKQKGEVIYNVRLNEFENDVWGVFYSYPNEAEVIEGWGVILPVIVDTFAPSQSSVPEAPTENTDSQEIKNIVDEFATAYFGGDVDTIHKFLTNPYEWDIDVYEGTGVISDLKVKALPESEQNIGSKQEISLEFRDSDYDNLWYLTFEFVKQEDGWKIAFYGLEG